MKTDENDFKIYLQKTSQEIQEELKNFSTEWNKYIGISFPELKKYNRQFTDSFFGGKMLRGTLVKLGYELVNSQPTDAIIKPAAAFEILHTALLIHDDIIDQSPVRRGRPALHMVNENPHYGIAQALCLGDLGLTLATKLLSEIDFPTERKNRALSYFLQIITDTILGEMLDVHSSHAAHRTEKQITNIQKMKTANYTIIGPLSLGAILAGASDELLKNVKKFGEHLGIAYQIQDDLLGIFGNAKTIGKSTTSDIEENKSTLLLTYSLKKGTKQHLTLLRKYYGKKGITQEHQEKIKQIFLDTGALTYNQNQITKRIAKAKTVILQLSKDKEKQKLLTQLTEALIKREK